MNNEALYLINEKIDRVIECLYFLSEAMKEVSNMESPADQIVNIGEALRNEIEKLNTMHRNPDGSPYYAGESGANENYESN